MASNPSGDPPLTMTCMVCSSEVTSAEMEWHWETCPNLVTPAALYPGPLDVVPNVAVSNAEAEVDVEMPQAQAASTAEEEEMPQTQAASNAEEDVEMPQGADPSRSRDLSGERPPPSPTPGPSRSRDPPEERPSPPRNWVPRHRRFD